MQAQFKNIRGKVTTVRSGEPIPFATIAVNGTTIATSTDMNGDFELKYDAPSNELTIYFVGYKDYVANIKDTVEGGFLDIRLEEETQFLKEAIIKTPKEKYKNKGNVAVELIKEVIDKKNKNKKVDYKYLSYEQYDKIQMAAVNVPDIIKKNPLFKKHLFVLNNADTTKIEGKKLIPLILEEHIVNHYAKTKPVANNSISKAIKRVSFDERFISNQSASNYLNHIYRNIDLYDDNVMVMTNMFLSPIADWAPTLYKYYITDTIQQEGRTQIEVHFMPRNKNDFLFMGKMYIDLQDHALVNAELRVSKDINLNWVNGVQVSINYTKSDKGNYYLSKSTLMVHFGLIQGAENGMFGERKMMVSNYKINEPIADSLFKNKYTSIADTPTLHSDEEWRNLRPESLTQTEEQAYTNMDSLNRSKSFRRLMDYARLAIAGYKRAGALEIGPVPTFVSFNQIEGLRLRGGGRTAIDAAKNFHIETYAAYGFKDQKWKYFLSGAYSFNGKTNMFHYPQNFIRASYQNDLRIPGQPPGFIQESNFFLSFKRGVNDKFLYNKVFRLEYVREFGNHFRIQPRFENMLQYAAGGWQFVTSDIGRADTLNNINTTDLGVELRWAPGEQFMQGRTSRAQIGNDKPIITANANLGIKGIMGSQYEYQAIRLNVFKRVYLSQLGFANVRVGGGYIWGQLPMPLLDIAAGNQTYAFQVQSYNLMNFMEFVSDQYTFVNIDYHMYGFLFNKIPIFKQLKFRETASFKMIYGTVRDENRPELNNNLIKFPTDKSGTPTTFSLEQKPYMEASVGIENILNVFRVECVWRLNYLDRPNVTPFGVRLTLQMDF